MPRARVDPLLNPDKVSRNKLWGDVQRAMGYSGPSVLAAQLKAAYTRIISPYEFYRAQVRHDPSPSQNRRVQPSRSTTNPSASGRASRTGGRPSTTAHSRASNGVFPSSAATPPSSPLTPSSSPLSEPPDDSDPQSNNGGDVKMNGPNDEGANAFTKALAQDREFIHVFLSSANQICKSGSLDDF